VATFAFARLAKDQRDCCYYSYLNWNKNKKNEKATGEAKEGGVLSPLLSNIYLHEFDIFMNSLIEKYSN